MFKNETLLKRFFKKLIFTVILQKAEVELAEKSVLTNREGCNILKKENSCHKIMQA